jgi:hypothetical protein
MGEGVGLVTPMVTVGVGLGAGALERMRGYALKIMMAMRAAAAVSPITMVLFRVFISG